MHSRTNAEAPSPQSNEGQAAAERALQEETGTRYSGARLAARPFEAAAARHPQPQERRRIWSHLVASSSIRAQPAHAKKGELRVSPMGHADAVSVDRTMEDSEPAGYSSARGLLHRFRVDLLVLLVSCCIFLPLVISPPHLMDDVDAVQAQIARNMLQSGDWVTARLDGSLLLTGLIAAVFPIAIAAIYLLITREASFRELAKRLRPFSGVAMVLLIAAPWHILATLRNPPYFDWTMHSGPGEYHGFFRSEERRVGKDCR